MSTLYVSEFAGMPIDPGAALQEPDASQWVQDQTVAVSASSATSNAFSPSTRIVILSSDVVCSIAWVPGGGSKAATATNLRIPANFPLKFGVDPGMAVSVITNT